MLVPLFMLISTMSSGEKPKGTLPCMTPGSAARVTTGPAQVDAFALSVRQHVEAIEALPALRGTKTSLHPLFGPFDAHQWNCMFAFHLKLHLRQARFVVNNAACRQTPGAVL